MGPHPPNLPVLVSSEVTSRTAGLVSSFINTEPLAIERKGFMHDGGPIALSIPVKHLENFSEPWTRLSALFWLWLRRAVPKPRPHRRPYYIRTFGVASAATI